MSKTHSIANMDTIIDRALLRAAGLALEPSDLRRTSPRLNSAPSIRNWVRELSIRRYNSGLAGEIACLRGRAVFYEFVESYATELLAGTTEELWTPISLGAAENAVGTEVAGLFWEDMDDDFRHTAPTFAQRCWLISGGRIIWPPGNHLHSMASPTQRTQRRSGGLTASAFGARKPMSRPPV